jgi:hypothetical protein
MHELAEQWKQFGTSTIHKLESQIVDYQEKLNELDQRQNLLVQENQSLKALVDQLIMQPNVDVNKFNFFLLNKLFLFFFRFRKNLNRVFRLKRISRDMNLLIILVFIVPNQFMINYLEQHRKFHVKCQLMILFNNKFLFKICSMLLK